MSDAAEIGDTGAIPGDRGPAVVARRFSLQARLQNALALGVVLLIGGGFLTWYYTRVAAEPPPPDVEKNRAATQGEMPLPALGPAPPQREEGPETGTTLVEEGTPEAVALLAPPPEDTTDESVPAIGGAAPAVAPVDPVRQRRLEAPVMVRGTAGVAFDDGSEDAVAPGETMHGTAPGAPRTAGKASGLGERLVPTAMAAAIAGRLPDRRLLLPKGAFIDCTLETAIDSSLPGMTTCVTATDMWSADGSVVLFERGSKLVGETRGDLRTGQERLFVLWSEARTPTGVIVTLASPGTDELGRGGVTGAVDTRFGARFGAAILISVIDAATAALVAAQGEGGSSVVIAPQGASDVVAGVLRETVNVPPTIRVAQGARLQVLVARDVSFADVYTVADR